MLRAELAAKVTFELKVVLGQKESAKPWRHVPDRFIRLNLTPDILFGLFQDVRDFREQLNKVRG